MAVRPIVTFGDPRLRRVGAPITRFDRELGVLLDDMVETMRAAPGAGLAAQQIGLALQLCVIDIDGTLHEVANPRLVHVSGEADEWEGCLSLPGYRGLRRRASRAVMTGQDRTGRRITIAGKGDLARAIQHEFDHLQGIVYTDGLPAGAEILTEAQVSALLAAAAAERKAAAARRAGPSD